MIESEWLAKQTRVTVALAKVSLDMFREFYFKKCVRWLTK